MLHAILPLLEEIPKGIPVWKDYLEESREGHNDKYELEGGGTQGRVVQRQNATRPQFPQWPDRWSWRWANSSYPKNTWAVKAYYHLSLWLPGISFSWSLFVEDKMVRIPPS